VQYVVEELANSGIQRLMFITGPGKASIENHFDTNWELISFLRETGREELLEELDFERQSLEYFYTRQRRQLGLGHAVLCARPMVGDQPFVVALGDSIIGVNAQSDIVARMVERFESEAADVVVAIGTHREAGGEGLAPTTSTTVMMAVGDALALVASRDRQFTRNEFARCHPAGSLGRRLASVVDVMRTAAQLRVTGERASVREVLSSEARPGRRTGAVLVVDENGVLVGIFTDSDLARLLEQHQDQQLDRPISEVMTVDPLRVGRDDTLERAVEILTRYKISELPVVGPAGEPIGLVDITDVIGLAPQDGAAG